VTGDDCYQFVLDNANPREDGDDNRNAR